jgi:murein DD-endopeptidase MepM/ murein hydrolase activator NlpD
MVNVTQWMFVDQGSRLGLINDTGNSALDHLHLSIHDARLPGAPGGLDRSVRMTPFDGRQTLEDGDEGSCIRSSNTPVPP